MSVYIEYVVLDNLIINFLILLCVKNSLKLKTKFWQMGLSSLIGTIVACVLPLFNLAGVISFAIKLALGVVMVLILSKFYRFRDFAIAFLLFIGYTFLLGGACLATLLVFGTSLEALASGGYDTSVPLGIILAICTLYVYIIVYVARFLSRRKNISKFISQISIFIQGKVIKLNAFIDTGNKLIDQKTGLPVIIVSLNCLEHYFSSAELESLMLNQKGAFKNIHTTPFSTVAGDKRNMVVFEAEKLCIFWGAKEYTTNRFVVGVTYTKFKDCINYDCLLSPYLCEV